MLNLHNVYKPKSEINQAQQALRVHGITAGRLLTACIRGKALAGAVGIAQHNAHQLSRHCL